MTSGLGGMSGAQAKASVIAGCVGVIAEVRGWECVGVIGGGRRCDSRVCEGHH